jgi:hypothetical protein
LSGQTPERNRASFWPQKPACGSAADWRGVESGLNLKEEKSQRGGGGGVEKIDKVHIFLAFIYYHYNYALCCNSKYPKRFTFKNLFKKWAPK